MTQVHRIVMNLATNAAHAMGPSGTLQVTVAPFYTDDEFIRRHPGMNRGLLGRLTVRDTGVGMPPTVAARIFEPFFTTKPDDEACPT